MQQQAAAAGGGGGGGLSASTSRLYRFPVLSVTVTVAQLAIDAEYNAASEQQAKPLTRCALSRFVPGLSLALSVGDLLVALHANRFAVRRHVGVCTCALS